MQSHLPVLVFLPFLLSLLVGCFLLDFAVDAMEGEVLIAFLREDGCEIAFEAGRQVFVVLGDPL